LGSTDPVLAIDIGGTKIAVGVIDSDGIVITSDRGPTMAGPDDDAEAIWNRLHELCERVLDRAGRPTLQGVGVGCGGPMTWPDGAVSPLNMPAWRGFPLRSRLRATYPGLPVRVHNDAIAVVVAEHWKGAGRGVPNMLGMVVSTGVGGGLVLGGRLIDGATGNAGHVGHIVVDPDGPRCGCGGHGCVEAIARGPALAEWAHAQGWRTNDPAATARELADDARAGDKLAIAAFERAGRAVGMGIASAVATCDVTRIVVGGGISQVGSLLFDPLEHAFREYARMDFTKGATVGPASLDQNAGIVGASAFILAGDRYWSAD
jgi:glucokinase